MFIWLIKTVDCLATKDTKWDRDTDKRFSIVLPLKAAQFSSFCPLQKQIRQQKSCWGDLLQVLKTCGGCVSPSWWGGSSVTQQLYVCVCVCVGGVGANVSSELPLHLETMRMNNLHQNINGWKEKGACAEKPGWNCRSPCSRVKGHEVTLMMNSRVYPGILLSAVGRFSPDLRSDRQVSEWKF